jgi:membrane associated rhomboid family serine protease
MAFRSNSPVMLQLPHFRGVTRRILLIAIGTFFAVIVLSLIAPGITPLLVDHAMLHPEQVKSGLLWELLTYPFLNGLSTLLFAGFSFWTFGSMLEDERGSHWFFDYLLVATAGGGLLACLIAYAHIPGIDPDLRSASLWPAVMAIMLAFARFNPDMMISLIIVQVKARHIAAIYLLFYLAVALAGGDRFGAVLALTNALAGYLYIRFAPRRGLRFGLSEWAFGLRNRYYRAKRKQAARKFEVYMRDQGKDVRLDPNDKAKDPNDRRWMN